MHIGGHGDPVKMAEAIRSALTLSKTPFNPPAAAPTASPAMELDTAQLDQIIGVKGQANGSVYQFNVPRRDPITETGMTVPIAMGSANAINFQPTGAGKAAVTGDFVITGDEVNPMIKTLRANGIEVTANHSHMLTEPPRVFFVHSWANDDAPKLAKRLGTRTKATAPTTMIMARATIATASQIGRSVCHASRTVATSMLSLSAIGSRVAPKVDTSLNLRAM